MERLARTNRTVVFIGVLALVLLGLFLPGVAGGIVLFALAAAVFALFARTAADQPPPIRAMRGLVLVGLVIAALIKIM